MKNKSFKFLLLTFFLASCGGGGGSSLVLTVQQFNSFSVNEDTTYETVISASTNKNASITYTISKQSVNANLSISDTGQLSYIPSPNYYGSDNFAITVSASSVEGSSGSYESTTLDVNVTVNPINDEPFIIINEDLTLYNESTLVFDDLLSINVTISDVDNSLGELSIYGSIDGRTFDGSFTEDLLLPGSGTADINVRSNQLAGFQKMGICVSDGTDSVCGGELEAYFLANREIKTIDYCDSTGNNCTVSDQYSYYLVGGENTDARTNYLFIGDQLTGEVQRDSFHEALLASVNLLVSSDAADLVDGYFNIMVLEEVDLTGVSLFDIRTGCYSFDENIYCIGEVDRNFMSDVVPGWTVTSFLTTLGGRGVAQGSVNIQPISSRSRNVVMHELGHSHGYMGDEYDSGGERTAGSEWWGDWSINTTTVINPNLVKWKHHIDFDNPIPGIEYDTCYNYPNASILYRDLDTPGITDQQDNVLGYGDCECFMNQWQNTDENAPYYFQTDDPDDWRTYWPDADFDRLGENSDPGCKDRVGLVEGIYYAEQGGFRPKWWTIMWCCTLEYGEVNLEGFAIGSIMNQGFRDYMINGDYGFDNLSSPDGLENSITLGIDAVYDQTKLKLKWFLDGIEQPEHENKLSVTFDRPSTNSWVSYSYQVEDLSGNLIAPNDPLSPVDFYEGNFESYYYYEPNPELTPIASLMPYIGSFRWYDPNSGWSTDESVNSSNMDNYLFAISCCSMGSTFKINWSNYQQTSAQMSSSNDVKKYFFERPKPDSNQKIFNLNLSKDNIKVISTTIERPNLELIREPTITKNDIYGLEFYNTKNELVYKVGIGDPFMVRLQHIDMEDKEHFAFEAPISNFNVVIPIDVNPSYVSLIRRNSQNIYSEVSRYILN